MLDNYRKNEIKVGIFSVVGIVLLLAIALLVNGFFLGKETRKVSFVFGNSLGIAAGAPITLNGVTCGTVEEVTNKNNLVYIKGTISKDINLRSDAYAIISMLEIMGGKKIELFLGISDDAYNFSSPIVGMPSNDIATLISNVGNTLRKVDALIAKITIDYDSGNIHNILQSTDTMLVEANKLMQNNTSNVTQTLNNLTQASTDLKHITNNAQQQINSVVDNTNGVLNQANNTLNDANIFVNNANSTLNDINEILTSINDKKGTPINTLLYDEDFSKKLDTLLQNTNQLLQQLKQHGLNTNIRLGTRP